MKIHTKVRAGARSGCNPPPTRPPIGGPIILPAPNEP